MNCDIGFAVRRFGHLWRGLKLTSLTLLAVLLQPVTLLAFEGRISAVMVRGNQTNTLLYTVATNVLRIENPATDRPQPVDLWNRNSGSLTLLLPRNGSFIRLRPVEKRPGFPMPGVPGPAVVSNASGRSDVQAGHPPGLANWRSRPQPPGGLPPGIGPQPGAMGGSSFRPGGNGMSVGPMMPRPPQERAQLRSTDDTTNLLGFTCSRYELKQRGETMEIWATDQLLPFQPYVRSQRSRFGPRRVEEQWGEVLRHAQLFPLQAVLLHANGVERLRFEVWRITPEHIEDPEGRLLQPPPDYHEIEPLPF